MLGNYPLTIIDDVEEDINMIKRHCEKTNNLEVSHYFTDATLGLYHLMNGPDGQIVLLDISMPQMSGMEIALKVMHRNHYIIFTTAHDGHALEAYKARVKNYLCKPFNLAEFLEVITAALNEHKWPGQPDPFADSLWILLHKDNRQHLTRVYIPDLILVSADDKSCDLHTTVLKHKTGLTLTRMQEILAPYPQFYQVHRSHIVNGKYVTRVIGNMLLLGELKVDIGPSYKDDMMNIIKSKTPKYLSE